MRISDWSSDVCSSDLNAGGPAKLRHSFPARLAGAHPRPAGVAEALHGTRSRGQARGAGDRSRGEGASDRAHGGFDTGWADGPATAPTHSERKSQNTNNQSYTTITCPACTQIKS